VAVTVEVLKVAAGLAVGLEIQVVKALPVWALDVARQKEIAALEPLAVTLPLRVAPEELIELAEPVDTEGALAGIKLFTVP
jgi:hypothetical protein